MYTVLLRELGYSEDFDIAELEIELEAEGKLPEFIATCKTLLNKDWETVRIGRAEIITCERHSESSLIRNFILRRIRGHTLNGIETQPSPSAR